MTSDPRPTTTVTNDQGVTFHARLIRTDERYGLADKLTNEGKASLNCPECKEEIWDLPHGHKLAKCWNAEGHQSGAPFAFDTMGDDDDSE